MKTTSCFVLAAAGLATLLPASRAADEKSVPKEEKRSLRVVAGPERERRLFVPRDSGEKEIVAFLGVETGPVSPTLSVQLALTRGTGLVVNHVVPKSPAEGALNEHDILLQLDDQILIETRQLSVLIRSRKEGDEVTLTFLRGGQKKTAKVKLGKTEVSKMSAFFTPGVQAFGWSGQGGPFELAVPGPGGFAERRDVDGVLSMIQRSHNGEPVRIQLDSGAGPGFRAMSINTGNSNLVFSDEQGSLELTTKDGVKSLVATSPKGESLFSGPVTTPEERQAMPAELRERLEKLEGMRDVTFRTDGDFKGAETKVVRPRGIALPLPQRVPLRPAPPAFF